MRGVMARSVALRRRIRAPVAFAGDRGGSRRSGRAIDVGAEINDDFRYSERGTRITAPRERADPGGRRRCSPSAAASPRSIRRALDDNGYDARPRYDELDIDLATQMAGPLRHINYYTTFSIRQEIERVLDGVPAEPPHLPIAAGRVEGPLPGGWEALWQDPLRHGCRRPHRGGDPRRDGQDRRHHPRRARAGRRVRLHPRPHRVLGRHGHRPARVVVEGAHVVARRPTASRSTSPPTRRTYDNLRWVCQTIAERFPGKPVVISVSPVSMLNTFTGWDVVVANTYGKSMLRTVAGAVETSSRTSPTGRPTSSCTHADIYKPDGRHVRDDAVDYVVGAVPRRPRRGRSAP